MMTSCLSGSVDIVCALLGFHIIPGVMASVYREE